MREKTFKNTPMGRSKIPEKPGEYILLDIRGQDVHDDYCRWIKTDNLKRKIKEVHYNYNLNKKIKFIRIKYGKRKNYDKKNI